MSLTYLTGKDTTHEVCRESVPFYQRAGYSEKAHLVPTRLPLSKV